MFYVNPNFFLFYFFWPLQFFIYLFILIKEGFSSCDRHRVELCSDRRSAYDYAFGNRTVPPVHKEDRQLHRKLLKQKRRNLK